MTEHLPEPGRADIRAGDADRELVARLLTDAFSSGQLTVSEYDARTAAAYSAKTYGDLDVLTSDLALASSTPPVESAAGPSHDRAVAIMSGFERKGDWAVARRIDAVAFWGGGEIDLRKARFPSRHVTINCIAIMGGIEIVVPSTVGVETRGAGIMGGFDHLSRTPPTPDAPMITITGFAFWGGVGIKNRD